MTDEAFETALWLIGHAPLLVGVAMIMIDRHRFRREERKRNAAIRALGHSQRS